MRARITLHNNATVPFVVSRRPAHSLRDLIGLAASTYEPPSFSAEPFAWPIPNALPVHFLGRAPTAAPGYAVPSASTKSPSNQITRNADLDPPQVFSFISNRSNITGNGAISIALGSSDRNQKFVCQTSFASTIFVSTVGHNDTQIQADTSNEDKEH